MFYTKYLGMNEPYPLPPSASFIKLERLSNERQPTVYGWMVIANGETLEFEKLKKGWNSPIQKGYIEADKKYMGQTWYPPHDQNYEWDLQKPWRLRESVFIRYYPFGFHICATETQAKKLKKLLPFKNISIIRVGFMNITATGTYRGIPISVVDKIWLGSNLI